MTPVEKIYNEESTNTGVMILRPEGMFYRAYEHSAFLVCKTVKEFKPTKRFFKKIGKEVVSIGFPQDTYGKYIGERVAVFDADGTIRVQSGAEIVKVSALTHSHHKESRGSCQCHWPCSFFTHLSGRRLR